jgi:hypothetical protein
MKYYAKYLIGTEGSDLIYIHGFGFRHVDHYCIKKEKKQRNGRELLTYISDNQNPLIIY